LGRSLLTFSRSRHKKSEYAELTVCPIRTYCLWTLLLVSKETVSMHLTLLFTYVATFSVSGNLDFPCTACAFFREHLYNQCQDLRRTFLEISM
jgi:hypothetical protein